MSEVEKGSYADLLTDIKVCVQTARIRAGRAVNQELIQLYRDIGRLIAERQGAEGWSSSLINRLSTDIRHGFPDLKGFSVRNIWRICRPIFFMRSVFFWMIRRNGRLRKRPFPIKPEVP